MPDLLILCQDNMFNSFILSLNPVRYKVRFYKMELLYIFRILYRKRWVILFCTFLAIVAAFVFTMNQKKLYRSLAQISTGYTVSEDIKMSNETFNIQQIDVKFNNAIENITSSKVVSLLAYNLLIHDLTTPKPFRKIKEKDLKKNPGFQKLNKEGLV